MRKMIVTSMISLLMLVGMAWGGTLISQNFEDETVFIPGVPFEPNGIGNGQEIMGIWKNEVTGGDYTPKIVDTDNSVFSVGSQCVHLQRTSDYGSGFMFGHRTNNSTTGEFTVELAFKLMDPACQFSLSVVDQSGGGGNQVAIAYYSNKLHTHHNDEWKARTSWPSNLPDKWWKIMFVGSIATETYTVYIDVNDGVGYRPVNNNDSFDSTELSNVGGIIMHPWLVDFNFYVDDVTIRGDFTVPTNCSEALELNYGLSADFNGDCVVDWQDGLIMVGQWLECVDPQEDRCAIP